MFRTYVSQPWMAFFAIALGVFEGVNIASIGLTLHRVSADFHLSSLQAGSCAGITMAGMVIGAMVGGRVADRYGRKPVLFLTTLAIVIFAYATSRTWDYGSFALARLATGLSTGGLMPLTIALVNDAAVARFRSRAISVVMASGALGGMVAGFVALGMSWRGVYEVCAAGPLVLLIAMLIARIDPNSVKPIAKEMTPGALHTLFSGARARGTLLIWVISFCTVLASYVMINWLPALLQDRGFSQSLSTRAMIIYSLGGIFGNLVAGWLMDRRWHRFAYVAGYLGASVCMVGLAFGTGLLVVGGLAFLTNFFILCAQLATIALTPGFYPEASRDTGIGAMVSIGRLGSVVGPLAVGQLLHLGLPANQLFLLLIPMFLVALALSMVFLASVRRESGAIGSGVAQRAVAAAE
jgi:AAHS family 3-hydroxyphenylpropionic acid transporter